MGPQRSASPLQLSRLFNPKPLKMKTYVLYHGNCPDGCGAALAAWLRLGDKTEAGPVEYIPVSYGKPKPGIEPHSAVYIIDFSYPRAELESLKEFCPELIVLDHHATAEKDLAGLPYCTFDMNKSGAVLAWEHFHGSNDGCNGDGRLPEFFAYLQDRDLWQFKLPMSREVSAALGSYPMEFRAWSELSQIRRQGNIYETQGMAIDNLKREGVACLRLKAQQVDNMARHHRWVQFDTTSVSDGINFKDRCGLSQPQEGLYYAPVANATIFFSEVGERLLELNPGSPFSAYYMDRNDGKRQWGLRSRREFDCSVIAKAFGGGGHKQASGFVQEL